MSLSSRQLLNRPSRRSNSWKTASKAATAPCSSAVHAVNRSSVPMDANVRSTRRSSEERAVPVQAAVQEATRIRMLNSLRMTSRGRKEPQDVREAQEKEHSLLRVFCLL